MKVRKTILLFIALLSAGFLFAQCCGGGSGSPIAGGSAQGVLQAHQMEINSNFQYLNTNTFFNGDSRDTAFYFDRFSSQYVYTRIAYGVTKDFTMSVESGYWLQKSQVGLHQSDTVTSSGIGDLILFPRYDILNRTSENRIIEWTIGLGFKIPLGKYNDSSAWIEPFSGNTYYITKPLSLQTSSGASDLIFYTFLNRGFPKQNFRVFANGIYIHKTWNPVGEKQGDFASIGLSASRSFYDKFGVTLQLRGEWIDQMKLNETVLLYAYPNYDPEATGSKKIFFSPQFSYTFAEKLTLYALADVPLYQYVTGNQAGSEIQFTAGLSFRFYTKKPAKECKDSVQQSTYQCPMKCEGKVFSEPGKCPVCGMELE